MPKSYLRKYFDDNNPVIERLNIDKKLTIRVINPLIIITELINILSGVAKSSKTP